MQNNCIAHALSTDGSLAFLEELSHTLQTGVRSEHPSDNEHRLVWSSNNLAGQAMQIDLKSGARLMNLAVRGDYDVEFELVQQRCCVTLCFFRTHSMQICTSDGSSLTTAPGYFTLARTRQPTRFFCRSFTRIGHDQLMVQFELPQLYDWLPPTGWSTKLGSLLREEEPFTHLQGAIPAKASRLLNDISQCTLAGPMRSLYLEEKVAELVMSALDSLFGFTRSGGESAQRDAKQLEYARGALLQTIDAPPSLHELARLSGLNDRRLKEGFKARFGTTVFGFVRRERMARAHSLLRDRRSVTEVALSVGYANPSKFAAAFRREFGVVPSALSPAL